MQEIVKKQPPEYQELIYIFASFEYALKAVGYYTENIEADWKKFVNDINIHLELPDSLKNLQIVKEPPRKQIEENHKITFPDKMPEPLSTNNWGEKPDRKPYQGIIGAVKTVRNNLFHGGKAGYYNHDIDRNISLVKDSIIILMELYKSLGSMAGQKCKKLAGVHRILSNDCQFPPLN